ncbi:MAG: phytanoyl-CoA dioxygenase family protein [Rhodospirillaceae bacterium]|nr:phytanoyl-CoA dioxygenase family protein [Rhodospirillaceae bacterium]
MADRPTLTDDPAHQASDLDRFGYCLIANALDGERLASVRQRIEEQAVAEKKLGLHKPGTDEEPDEMVNQWVHMLINKGRVFHEMALSPLAMRIAGHVLGEQFLLSDIAAHITWPDNGLMGLHIDQWWLPQPRMPGETYQRAGTINRSNVPMGDPVPANGPISPPAVLNLFWAITDFTVENGATRLVPGSHLSGRNPDPKRDNYPTVQAVVPAGSAVAWEGRTWHAAGFNRSNGPRIGITTYFCGPQYRQMANLTHGAKREAIGDASDELKALIGFKSWSGYGRTSDAYNDLVEPAENLIGELKP